MLLLASSHFPPTKLKFRYTFKRQLNLLNVCRIYLQNILYPFAFSSTPNSSRCIEVGQYLVKKSCLNGFVWLLCGGFLCCVLFDLLAHVNSGSIWKQVVSVVDLWLHMILCQLRMPISNCVAFPQTFKLYKQSTCWVYLWNHLKAVYSLICVCSVVTNFTVLILHC